jgi:hypothetical protein
MRLGLPDGHAYGQMTLWRNIDDKTGQAKAEIRITDAGGVLSGKWSSER